MAKTLDGWTRVRVRAEMRHFSASALCARARLTIYDANLAERRRTLRALNELEAR